MKLFKNTLLVGFILLAGQAIAGSNNLFPDDEAYSVVVEVPAAPVGGPAAIMKKINYPIEASSKKVEGKVYLLVYVNEQGEVDDVKVVKGIGSGCDEAAISAIKKTKFSPGMEKGVAVKTKVSMPIQFKL